MKRSLTIFSYLVILFFLSINTLFAQECLNTGYCSNATTNYPISPFGTPSSPFIANSNWTVVSSFINGGNFAYYHVDAGCTYFWSTCDTYGGSQGFDAQFTLKTSSYVDICFSDDYCGTSGLSPFISWQATFTGNVILLVNEYTSSPCQTNGPSGPYCTVVWGKSPSCSTPCSGAPSFKLTSPLTVSQNPITVGNYETVTATVMNLGPSDGPFDFECDFDNLSSGANYSVIGKECNITVPVGSTTTITFDITSIDATPVSAPIGYGLLYSLNLVVLCNNCFSCGNIGCPTGQVAANGFSLPYPLSVISGCNAPSSQASNITFSGVNANGMSLNWLNGNGSNRIVVAKANSPITGNPSNGTVYSANSTFGNGSQIAAGEYVVYDGTGSSASLSGLNPNTTYYFRIFEYNCNPTQFLTSTAFGNPNSQTTSVSCNPPNTQASNISFSSVASTTMTVNWANGNGNNRIVVGKANSSITGVPTNGSSYTASSTFGNGSQLGTGEYVVYDGSGSSVPISNLSPSTTYYFRVFEYSCNPTQFITSTASGNPNSQSTNSSTYTISGTVFNPSISGFTGGIQNNPINCTVGLYNPGTTSSPLYTVNSPGGNFSFSVTQNQLFDVIASYTNGITYTVRELNVPVNTTGLQLKLSENLIEQIGLYNDTLGNLECYISDINKFVPVDDYFVNSSNSFINSLHQIANNQSQDIESLERLCMAERLLMRYFRQAELMNNEFTESTAELAKFVFELTQIMKCGYYFSVLGNQLINWFQDFVVIPLDGYYQVALDESIDYIQIQNGPSSVIPLTILKEWIDPELTKWNISKGYVKNTFPLMPLSVSNSQNGTFSGNITNTVSNLSNQLGTSETNTLVAQAYAQSYRQQPGWVNLITGISNLAISYTCGTMLYVNLLGFGLDAVKVGFLSASIYQSVHRVKQLDNEATLTVQNSFLRLQNPELSTFNSTIASNKLQTTSSTVSAFETEYSNTISDIVNGNNASLPNHLNNLIQLNKSVNDSVLDVLNSIKSAIPFSTISDSSYVTLLQNALYGSPFIRYAHLSSIAYYIQNPVDTLKDSLVVHAQDLYSSDSLMLTEISNVQSLLAGITSPGYIAVYESNIPLTMIPSADSLVTIKIKNYGSTATTGLYAKINFTGAFYSSIDSIYIGNLGVNQIGSIAFTVFAPSILDTISSYSIEFYANSGITNHKGGAIVTRNLTTNIIQSSAISNSILVSPNPTNGILSVNFNSTTNSNAEYIVYNALSQVVFLEDLKLSKGENRTQIDLSKHPSGIYFLSIQNKGEIFRQKIVKE